MNITYIYKIFIIFGLIQGALQIQATPLISRIVLRNNKIIIRPNKLFKKKYLRDDFFASYRQEDVDLKMISKSTLVMPFLMNVIPIIWLSGETWEVDEVDEALFESLTLLKKIFVYLYPNAQWNGQLKVNKLIRSTIESTQSNTFAMPFSGGLDSIHTSLSHSFNHQILITVKEHRGYLNDAQWNEAIKNVTRFAQQWGHENTFIDSNYQRFIKDGKIFSNTPDFSAATSHGLGWFGLAVPILVAKKCSHFKIASSIEWSYPLPNLLCPMVDDTIKFANITVAHDGFDCTRADKMDMVSSFFKNKKHECILYVCQKNHDGTNCCACEKCIRTICALIAAGQTSFEEYGFTIGLEQAQFLIQREALKWVDGKYWRLEALQKKIKEKKSENNNPFCEWLSNLKINKKRDDFNYRNFASFVQKLKETKAPLAQGKFIV